MGDGFQEIPAGAIHLRKGDERAAQVVAAAPAHLEHVLVLVELLGRLLGRPLGHVARGCDEVVRHGHAAIGSLPARQLPLGQDAGQGGVHGDAPGDLGFRLAEVQRAQRLRLLVVAIPSQPSRFAVPEAGQALQGVQHAAILGDAGIRNEVLDFVAGIDGFVAPVGILVGLLGQDPPCQNAGSCIDEFIDDRALEKKSCGLEDVVNRSRRERSVAQVEDEVVDMAGPDLVQDHMAEPGQHVLGQPAGLVFMGDEVQGFAFLQPSGRVLRHGDGRPWFKAGGVGQLPCGFDSRGQPLQVASCLCLLAFVEGRPLTNPFAGFVLVAGPQSVSSSVKAGHGDSSFQAAALRQTPCGSK